MLRYSLVNLEKMAFSRAEYFREGGILDLNKTVNEDAKPISPIFPICQSRPTVQDRDRDVLAANSYDVTEWSWPSLIPSYEYTRHEKVSLCSSLSFMRTMRIVLQ